MSKVPTSPGVPGTPSAKARICKKLVIKGHASSSGASYTLFLKVQLPATEQEEIYDLLKDPAVELQDTIVHRLDASGAAPALSTSAATAASSLGIPLLAVPFCLNNFMRFTVDESIDQDLGSCGLAVEVDPPILPISGQLKSSQRRPPSSASSRRALSVASLSDEEDVTLLGAASVDDSDLKQDESAIVGPFHACDTLVLRIAAPQAGDWVSSDLPYRTLHNALRAKKAVSSITFQPRARQLSEGKGELSSDVEDEDGLEVAFEAAIKLQEPFFPGLDREVLLYMQLDPPASVISWQPKAVDASRGILSWSFGSLASTSSSPNQLPRLHSDGVLTKCPTFDIGDLVVLPDPAQQAADEEDLLKVAPPKGIHDVDFDFSLDNATATPIKQRRFSLQSAGSAKPYPSQPPSEHSEAVGGTANMLVVAFNLLPVLQSDEPVVISVRGTRTDYTRDRHLCSP
ncbi:hypothetical protein NDA16_002186 [Ustilago loliicola]|nr:hypothetical protein NDA16_002186 [Ustilago loliicola]